MTSGRKKNRQKKESGETNTKQKDIIHYIKKVNIDGVKQIINITKEDYEAIKDDPNQTTTALTHKQWQAINYYEAVCADPKRYQEKLKKVQDRMNTNCYYKKIEQDGLIKYELIKNEKEYTQNKDKPNFFQGLYKEFNENRNYLGEIYIDSDRKKVPKKIYQKMTQEERNKKFTIVQAGLWRRDKSNDKKRKRDNNNNNNQQTIPTQLEGEPNLPPQSFPVASSANVEQPENPHTFQDNSAEPQDNNSQKNIDINNLVARFPEYAHFRFFVGYNRLHAGSQQVNNNNQNNNNPSNVL